MKALLPPMALTLLGLTVTSALVASTIARAVLVDETGSEGGILIIEAFGLLAGLALALWGLMGTFLTMAQQRQARCDRGA